MRGEEVLRQGRGERQRGNGDWKIRGGVGGRERDGMEGMGMGTHPYILPGSTPLVTDYTESDDYNTDSVDHSSTTTPSQIIGNV